MSEKIVQLNEEVIKGQIKELVITESLCKITEIQQKRTGRDLVHEISTGFLLLGN